MGTVHSAEERAAGRGRNHGRTSLGRLPLAAFGTASPALAAGVVASVAALLGPAAASGRGPAGRAAAASESGSRTVQAAVRSCDRSVARSARRAGSRAGRAHRHPLAHASSSASTASVRNVLTDVSGKYVAVLATDRHATYVCVDGDAAGEGSITFRSGTIPGPAATGHVSLPRFARSPGVEYVNGRRVAGLEAGSHAYGRAGGGVSELRLGLEGGSTVKASIEHGWYFAWWPSGRAPSSVQVTAPAGRYRFSVRCAPGISATSPQAPARGSLCQRPSARVAADGGRPGGRFGR